MKMLDRSFATPCPIASSLEQLLNTDINETTTTINFTTELGAAFRNARPRRRQTQSTQFAIHEDDGATLTRSGEPRQTLLQPPRRIQTARAQQDPKTKTSHFQHGSMKDLKLSQQERLSHNSHLVQAPKRSTTRLSAVPESAAGISNICMKSPVTEVFRPARRGTIYIPNEDTTMPSMYMGIFSPVKHTDLPSNGTGIVEIPLEMEGIGAQMAIKKTGRKSIMGGVPRRGVLHSSRKPLQETTQVKDRYGQGGGKENIPPGAVMNDKALNYLDSDLKKHSTKRKSIIESPGVSTANSNIFPSTASASPRQESPRTSIRELRSKPVRHEGQHLEVSKAVTTTRKTLGLPTRSMITELPRSQVRTPSIVPNVHTQTNSQKFTVLQEDIVDPSMHEEGWLRHQEIVITQLINSLFSAYQPDTGYEYESFRKRLLGAYCSTPILLMHKRLQAALLYGSLSIPQDTLKQGTRLQNDIGLKKQFTDLWLCTYDLNALRAALEVVVGRECHTERSRSSTGNLLMTRPSKSRLRSHVEAFLIRNEDAKPDAGAKSHTAWAYQRTLLRSLLLVKVLDLAKSERSIGMKGCLFQRSSPCKSSSLVVQKLFRLLNPSAGDPIRALGHIDYNVFHNQRPLEEFDFHIQNLAVDLRDGVRLTRIVELLLYPGSAKALDECVDNDTTTLFMPEGDETSELEIENGQDWTLSQHLKLTCQSRAVRMWNVQLALSAMNANKGVDSMIDGVHAHDIVDGFREKTIRLLWGLVGRWGLSGLFDLQDLKWEIRRLATRVELSPCKDICGHEFGEDDFSFAACKDLLRKWSRLVAACHGFEIANFTTSFADGRAFEAIISEYEPFVLVDDYDKRQKSSLRDRLVSLGCSAQFSQLFIDPKEVHIFDRDFVLAALAFLCSRLLPPSRRGRAATVIQRAWRGRCSRHKASQIEEKKRIALACVELVKSKQDTDAMSATKTEVSVGPESLQITTLTSDERLSSSAMALNGHEDIWLTL